MPVPFLISQQVIFSGVRGIQIQRGSIPVCTGPLNIHISMHTLLPKRLFNYNNKTKKLLGFFPGLLNDKISLHSLVLNLRKAPWSLISEILATECEKAI